jgi:hypothetical protein
VSIVELSAVMRPTTLLQGLRLGSVISPVDQRDERSHVGGGEVSMRVMRAPPMLNLPPGKWLAAVVEQWPNGHVEVLGAFHGDSAVEAQSRILPLYEQIMGGR